jgi:hypothetical protein
MARLTGRTGLVDMAEVGVVVAAEISLVEGSRVLAEVKSR